MADAAALASALEDRSYTGNILPFKTDKAGALSFAVPEMLQSLYRGGKELLNGPRDTVPGQTHLSPEALGALAAMMGIPGMATAERGAVGVAGGRLPAASLPMDEASRMARSKEMGFDVDAYHATVRDFGAFDNAKIGSHLDTGYYGTGHYTAPSPLNKRGEPEGPLTNYISSGYNKEGPQYFLGANIMPLKLKMNNPLIIDKADIPNGVLTNKVEAATGFKSTFGWPLGESERAAFMAAVKSAGFDGVRVDYSGKPIEYVTPDPKNIRSRFAAFDPAKKDSADLLAASGPAALAAAPKSRRDLLAEQISKVEK